MGEKIKNLDRIKNLDIELNKAQVTGGQRLIHLQNPNFRFCITEGDFICILVAIQKASKVLVKYKHIGDEDE